MKKLGFVILAMALMLVGSALAQNVGDNSVYFVTYYSNAHSTGAPDATVRVINDGDQGTGSAGDLWAAFYVFDDSQELTQCCACFVSPDGLLSESVNNELTVNPLTGRLPRVGVIKIISSASPDPTAPVPTPGLRADATHIQSTITQVGTKKGGGVAVAYSVTEERALDSNLGSAEQGLLGQLCYFDALLSGLPCLCTPEDNDF